MMNYEHGESIYNIIPPTVIPVEKPPMYRSSHRATVPPSSSTFGQAQTSHPGSTNIAGDAPMKVVADRNARTMGRVPGALKPSPQEPLKKASVRAQVPTLAEVKRDEPHLLHPTALKSKLRPDVPTAAEAPPIMNLVSSKDFVVANAVETILAAPKKVSSGAKDYLRKEDYGKTPKYLKHIKQDIDAEYDYIRQLQQQEVDHRNSLCRSIGDEEKEDLIEGLKAKWEQVNTDYQATTHLTKLDTIGKVKRKEKSEAELSQIEKDIEKLARGNILVDQTC